MLLQGCPIIIVMSENTNSEPSEPKYQDSPWYEIIYLWLWVLGAMVCDFWCYATATKKSVAGKTGNF